MPTTKKLTKRLIDSLEIPREKFAIYWDGETPGFGLRIMASGTKTFILDYRNQRGQQRRMKIGRYGVMTPDQARTAAKKTLNKIAAGADPLEDRSRARGAPTFRILAEEYIRHRCSEKRSGHEDERIIRNVLLPIWGRRLARDIHRGDVRKLGDEIKHRGAGIMANRTVALISRLFNFGLDRELAEANPASRMKPPAKETSRERVLENEEIKTLWTGIERIPGGPGPRVALQLILVTAQRPGEVSAIAWEDVDTENMWTIPAEKSKNGRTHRVPLSPLALELLDSLPRADTGPVFPSSVNPSRPLKRAAIARSLRRGRETLNLEHFTPHDLRRTAASKMAAMGISRLTIAKVLNHTDQGITAVYDRYGYDTEKRAALEAWAVKLSDIVSGQTTKIIKLRK